MDWTDEHLKVTPHVRQKGALTCVYVPGAPGAGDIDTGGGAKRRPPVVL